jgi:hypothetical protein
MGRKRTGVRYGIDVSGQSRIRGSPSIIIIIADVNIAPIMRGCV